MKHYPLNNKWIDGKGRTYISKCGQKDLRYASIGKAIGKVTCPECILQLMTDYEQKIALLEDRYYELFPDRPVGEKIQ